MFSSLKKHQVTQSEFSVAVHDVGSTETNCYQSLLKSYARDKKLYVRNKSILSETCRINEIHVLL